MIGEPTPLAVPRVSASLTHMMLFTVLAAATSLLRPLPTPHLSRARVHAIHAPLSELRREVFDRAARAFVEVERPTFAGLAGVQSDPYRLIFATRKRINNPGLCEATTVYVIWKPTHDEEPIETEKVYKVVGDLGPPVGGWTSAYGNKLASNCARAGRVLPTDTAAFDQVAFFHLTSGGANDAWRGARALQLAGHLAGTGKLEPGCKLSKAIEAEFGSGAKHDCDAPTAVLAGLSLSRLMKLEVKPCSDAGDLSCIEGDFLRSAEFNEQRFWHVRLRARLGAGDTRDVVAISTVELSASYMISD